MNVDFWADPLVQFAFTCLALLAMGVVKYRIAARQERQKQLPQKPVGSVTRPTKATHPSTPVLPATSRTETPAQPTRAKEMDATQRTLATVEALPKNVDWPLHEVKADHIPFMQDANGNWQHLSILDSEHTIVCGASGSGKGNLLRLLALSIMALGPQVAELWVLDTKSGVDYPICTTLGHTRLYANIKKADGSVTQALEQAMQEMERRNEQMFGVATNIHGYNKKVAAEDHLPIIVLVMDEFADFNSDQKALAETIARQGRSAGFVLFVATQYPTANVLSSQIQANCLRRICLKVESAKRTEVSLGIEPGEARTYEPSVIAPSGVAVYKSKGGKMTIGRVPHVTDDDYTSLSEQLQQQWSRVDEMVDEQLERTNGSNERTNERHQNAEKGPIQERSFVRSELDSKEDVIRTLLAAGWNKTRIRDLLKGTATELGETIDRIQNEG